MLYFPEGNLGTFAMSKTATNGCMVGSPLKLLYCEILEISVISDKQGLFNYKINGSAFKE